MSARIIFECDVSFAFVSDGFGFGFELGAGAELHPVCKAIGSQRTKLQSRIKVTLAFFDVEIISLPWFLQWGSTFARVERETSDVPLKLLGSKYCFRESNRKRR